MEEFAKKIGEIAVGVIAEAIRRGRTRRQALDEAIATLSRDDVVSDDLWNDLEAYVADTRDFEENGAG